MGIVYDVSSCTYRSYAEISLSIMNGLKLCLISMISVVEVVEVHKKCVMLCSIYVK